jgi:flagellar biosynthesis/type III secretory pathway protein FliH
MTRILKNQPILRPEYLATLATGREIVAAAQRSAQQIRERAERRGREQGLARAAAALVEAEMRRDRWLHAARADLAALSLQVASSLYARAREEDPSVVEDLCRQAIDQVGSARRIALRVNPADAGALEGIAAPVTIVADASITPGGCLVETDLGSVDGRLETRLDALRAALEAVVERHEKKDA